MTDDQKSQLAVYRDVVEALLSYLPTDRQLHGEVETMNQRLRQLSELRSMAQGALSQEGMDNALAYIKRLEKIAELLANADDDNGTPDVKSIYLAIDLAKRAHESPVEEVEHGEDTNEDTLGGVYET